MGPGKLLAGFVVVVLVLAAGVWDVCSSNLETPGGYVGYVTQGALLGRRKFVGTQVGPTSTGKAWLVDVQNVSVTPYTFDEKFNQAEGTAVLSKDGMQISFSVHTTFRVAPDRVKDFVEKYTTITPGESGDKIVQGAYDNFLKSRVQSYARDAVQRYPWQQLTQEIDVIGKDVSERVLALTSATPFDVQAVVVGNIQFPQSVADSVAEAQAASQVAQRKQMEVQQARADADKRVAEAKGIAEAMDLVNQKLTPQYIQYEAIKAQEGQINSPNHTVVYIPVGNMGVPLVSTVEQPATTSTAAAAPPR